MPPRPGHTGRMAEVRRWGTAALLALAVLPLGAGVAAADVVVLPEQVAPGARNLTLTFRLSDPDPTTRPVRLQVFLPTGRPLVGVSAPARPGWTSRLSVDELAEPAPSLDGPVREVVTAIEWNADPAPDAGSTVDLPVQVGLMPGGAGPVRFRAVVTDRDGRTEEWSNTWAEGAAPPAHDALLVRLGDPLPPPVPGTHGDHHGEGSAAVTAASAARPASPTAVGWTVAGLLAAGGALAALSAALGRRQQRRFAAVHAAPSPADPLDEQRGDRAERDGAPVPTGRTSRSTRSRR